VENMAQGVEIAFCSGIFGWGTRAQENCRMGCGLLFQTFSTLLKKRKNICSAIWETIWHCIWKIEIEMKIENENRK